MPTYDIRLKAVKLHENGFNIKYDTAPCVIAPTVEWPVPDKQYYERVKTAQVTGGTVKAFANNRLGAASVLVRRDNPDRHAD